eukprot:SAG31_NODE_127_length_23612_cov_39.709863_19_plen_153_part_00
MQALDEVDDGWGIVKVEHGMQTPSATGEDPRMQRQYFHRSAEEEEELGLDQMKTELGEDGQYHSPAQLQKLVKEREAARGMLGTAAPKVRRARGSHILVTDENSAAELKAQLLATGCVATGQACLHSAGDLLTRKPHSAPGPNCLCQNGLQI